MKKRLLGATALSLILLLLVAGHSTGAAQNGGRIMTPQGEFNSLEAALAQAQAGDTIEVYGGEYAGPLVLDQPLNLIGHDWPVIDGQDQGTVVTLAVPGIHLQGFTIRNSGDSLDEENSGIAVEAPNARIENNRLEGTLFGIYLRKAHGSLIRDNVIRSKDLPVPRRGDPIRVWYSNDVVIEGNEVDRGRDVVLWYSERLKVENNEISNGRYGLHFMYCDDATIENNLLTNNSVGTFLMYSRRLHLVGNTISFNRGPSGFGVGLKDMDDALIKDNLFLDNRIGAHLDNSPREVNSIGRFEGNVFAFNDIGINLMPSVRHNEFYTNSFIDNEQQVSIAGGGGQADANLWSVNEQGNYWSDYVGYDANADGIGDVPYKAERLFENLADQNSSLRLFLYSPAEQALDLAARLVPFVKPHPKLTDGAPLLAPLIPAGIPEVPQQSTQWLWIGSSGLLLLALAGLVFGSYKRRTARIWSAKIIDGTDQSIASTSLNMTQNRG